MRRRILAAILGVVAAALVLTGTGTYLLLQSQAAGTTEAGLRAQTGSMVRLVDDSRGLGSTPADRRKILRGLKVEGVAVRLTDADGQTIGTLPDGVVDGDIDQSVLNLGGTVSGRHGDLVWAAAGLPRTNGTTLSVVMTAPVEAATAPVGWYLLSAAVVCALAALVAWVLSPHRRRRPGHHPPRARAEAARRDGPAHPVHQRHGRRARPQPGSRAPVPALGVARPAHPAHLDPRVVRGDRRRHGPGPDHGRRGDRR